jgi:hypothetical protein
MFKEGPLAAGRHLVIVLGILGVQPALACSGFPPISYQHQADVVVAGRVAVLPGEVSELLMARRVMKGEMRDTYRIVWQPVDYDDECAFLSPEHRDRGVFFLRRREDGAYDVLWTEDRWKMKR